MMLLRVHGTVLRCECGDVEFEHVQIGPEQYNGQIWECWSCQTKYRIKVVYPTPSSREPEFSLELVHVRPRPQSGETPEERSAL